MNKERLLLLAETIENHSIPSLGFNMNYFSAPFDPNGIAPDPQVRDVDGRDCGTVACIAGWACALATQSGDPRHSFGGAAEWLDILPSDWNELFYPGDESRIVVYDWDKITPIMAASVIRRFVETGRVDWTAVLPEGEYYDYKKDGP